MAKFGNQGLDHVAIGVHDVERSQRWYADVLGFERAHQEWDVPVVMAAEGSGVAIFDKDLHPASASDDAEPPAIRVLHIAFRVSRQGFEEARASLKERGIDTSFSDHRIAYSLYFEDPDGHRLELTTYEV
jgi:catechol 2,3-dioxygenase-like lactoylglutathione lyase family enzyme